MDIPMKIHTEVRKIYFTDQFPGLEKWLTEMFETPWKVEISVYWITFERNTCRLKRDAKERKHRGRGDRWNLTCPKSMVMFTRWYWSPRDRGGDCHHFSVPSIACMIEWFLEDTLGSQWSQDSPRISNFPATVANLQNNSCSLTSSPHVEVASIFLPWAMLIAGRLSLCPWPDFGAKLTASMVSRMAITGFFIMETTPSLQNHPTIWRTRLPEEPTQTSLCVEKAMQGAQITLGVGWEEFRDFPRSPAEKPRTTFKNFEFFYKPFTWPLGPVRFAHWFYFRQCSTTDTTADAVAV